MNVGMVGMGKLGLPVALAIESKGHEVRGYDINPEVERYLEDARIPFIEEGLQPLLDNNKVKMASLAEVVLNSEIVFVPVQTPHDPQYEGATPIPETRKDFDYSYLIKAVGDIALIAAEYEKPTTLAVISTCLPGTFRREIKPLLNEYTDYVYTPQFIAMGTVLEDYLHPEFNLIGVENEAAADKLEEFYKTINDAPALRTDVTTAEAVKVSYNTYITMKTVLGNLWGEMAHKVGFNVDDIYRAWSMSDKRLMSPRYLRAGLGDGGGCHPRDNIALSYIADEYDISHNVFEDLMKAREDHMDWFARLCISYSKRDELPIVILGKAFKPETNIQTGSPAVLLHNLIDERYGYPVDQIDDEAELDLKEKALYFIGVQHDRYKNVSFPQGSMVIDPFRMVETQDGVEIIGIGQPKT